MIAPATNRIRPRDTSPIVSCEEDDQPDKSLGSRGGGHSLVHRYVTCLVKLVELPDEWLDNVFVHPLPQNTDFRNVLRRNGEDLQRNLADLFGPVSQVSAAPLLHLVPCRLLHLPESVFHLTPDLPKFLLVFGVAGEDPVGDRPRGVAERYLKPLD